MYSRANLLRILRIPQRQFAAWEKFGLITATEDYSFSDLLQVKKVRDMLAMSVDRKVIRESLEALRKRVETDPRFIGFCVKNPPLRHTLKVRQMTKVLPFPATRPDLDPDAIPRVAFELGPEHRAEIIPVTFDFARLLGQGDQKELFRLGDRQFEELIAVIFGKMGYEVELTAKTRDRGRDVIAVKRSEVNVRYLIECKRYAEDRKVGVEIVRALYGVKTDERATKAILATTSTFSAPAKEFFAEHVWELEPRDYKGTREWIELVMQCNDLGVFGEYGSREEI
jgi:hypothetical protein